MTGSTGPVQALLAQAQVKALALALALGSACATMPAPQVDTLPFHVAITSNVAQRAADAKAHPLPGAATPLTLELVGATVTAEVAAALETYCFTQVSVLSPEQAERPIEAALALQADLVLQLDLRYAPVIHRENASFFWLNYPLFLFAGPSHWFLGDNRYYADAQAAATLYDVHALEAGANGLDDAVAGVVSTRAHYRGAGLNFTERADGVADYLVALVVPSGYLVRESASAREGVHGLVVAGLAEELVHALQRERDDLVEAEGIAPVYLTPEDVHVTRAGADLVVAGQVWLRDDPLAERIRAVHIEAAGQRTSVRVQSQAGDPRLSFAARLANAATAQRVRIECETGGRDRFVRSYTFDVPWQPDQRAATAVVRQ